MLVTLPFVLLLLDYWPLQRVQFSKATPPDRSGPYRSSKIKLVVEKIPLLLVSAASCMMTLHVQHDGGAVASLAAYPLELRAVNALVAYASYIGKMIWPVNLAVLYPYSNVFPGWQVWTAALMLAGISFLALKYCASHPWLLVGWLWYLGTLVPVIGLVQAGSQAMADRYTYVPLIGMFIILVWGLASLTQRYRINPITKAVIAAVGIGALAVVSWNQVGYWQNSITLFRRALEVTENNYIAHNNLGHRLLELGKNDEARRHFKASIDIRPEFEIAHLNLGLALANQGKIDQAIKHYTQALRIKPQYAVAHNNIGNAWYRLGKADIASSHYRSAIEIQPDYADAYNNLGAALIRMGQAKRSVFFFSKALEINPEFEAAQQNLANTISSLANKKGQESRE